MSAARILIGGGVGTTEGEMLFQPTMWFSNPVTAATPRITTLWDLGHHLDTR